nr:meiotically up-regulated gene 154 protein [Quercus suber]
MPRLIRQQPLSERLKSYLDLGDWYLWLSEELNDDTYDEWLNIWAIPLGVGLNIVFILARGSGRSGSRRGRDDVFGDHDASNETGWLNWMVSRENTVLIDVGAHILTWRQCLLLVQLLTILSLSNALFTFFRTRKYRLFEQPVDAAPVTPSARRVRVDSSPMSASPLTYLRTAIASATASSRAYPDAEREVWELSLWDPKPFNLTIFTLFSPGHVLFYYVLLPPATLDPRPSVTVLIAIAFGGLLSLQLSILKSFFSQQAKDASLVHGQVMNEYDTKYVRPTLHHPVRDVGIQTRESSISARGTRTREVDVYTPTTIVNRGFHTNPNPNYSAQYDPDNLSSKTAQPSHLSKPTRQSLHTPTAATNFTPYSRPTTAHSATSTAGDLSSPLKPHHERPRERDRVRDGGYLGVYSHAASPLRQQAAREPRLERPTSRFSENESRRSISTSNHQSSLGGGNSEKPVRRRIDAATGRS